MPFFSRPNIDNIQFKQLSGSTLTMSGQTQIATPMGFQLYSGTTSGGTNQYIPVIATGGTNYDILTYRNGQILLLPQTGGGSGVYSGASPTTCTVGGLYSGTTIAGCSISTILEEILVPAISLTTSLSVATGFGGGSVSPSCRQFGDYSIGNLCWNVVKKTNLICAISASTLGNGVYNCNLLTGSPIGSTGGTVPYTYSYSCTIPPTGITSTSIGYNLFAKSCDGCSSASNANIIWQNMKFNFTNGTLYNCSNCINTILSATTGTLSATKALTISQLLNNEFFYYAYPKVLGTPSFTINGLPNNAWGNQSIGTLFTITFINTNGYSNQYYVARSDNKITGTYNIIIT